MSNTGVPVAQIRLSAKRLGEVALAKFCPRCFWLKYQLSNKLPYSIFPSIFGTIDRHTKQIVHSHFDANGSGPEWLKVVGDVVGYIDPPRAFDFQMPLAHDFVLSGEPDAILRLRDGTLAIADYKTAYCAGEKDPLLPMYLVQLNAYAMLAEAHKLGKVTKLVLLYTEPMVGASVVNTGKQANDAAFSLGFTVKSHELPLNPKLIHTCASVCRTILVPKGAPVSRPGCEDCLRVQAIVLAATRSVIDYARIYPAT